MRGTRIRYEYIKTFPPSLTNNLEYYSTRFSTNTHVLYIISFETNETLRHGGSGVIYLLSIFEILHRKSASEGKRACLSVSCVSPQVWVKSFVAGDKTLRSER